MSANAAPFSAAEFVRTLSDEQKEAVFYAILEEVMAANPEEGFVALGKGDGPITAFLVSAPELYALHEKYQFPISVDGTDEEAKRIPREQRDWLTTDELLEELEAEDEEPVPEVPPPSIGSRTAAER